MAAGQAVVARRPLRQVGVAAAVAAPAQAAAVAAWVLRAHAYARRPRRRRRLRCRLRGAEGPRRPRPGFAALLVWRWPSRYSLLAFGERAKRAGRFYVATLAQARTLIATAQQKQNAVKTRLPLLKGSTETAVRKTYSDGTASLNTAIAAVNKDPTKAYTHATSAQAAFDAGLRTANIPQSAVPASARTSATTHTVVRGDSLTKLGAHYAVDWRAIHAANMKVIGPDPGKIDVGMRLTIPKPGTKPPAAPPVVAANSRGTMPKFGPQVPGPSAVPPGVETTFPAVLPEATAAPAWVRPAVMVVGAAAAAGALWWGYKAFFGKRAQAA